MQYYFIFTKYFLPVLHLFLCVHCTWTVKQHKIAFKFNWTADSHHSVIVSTWYISHFCISDQYSVAKVLAYLQFPEYCNYKKHSKLSKNNILFNPWINVLVVIEKHWNTRNHYFCFLYYNPGIAPETYSRSI